MFLNSCLPNRLQFISSICSMAMVRPFSNHSANIGESLISNILLTYLCRQVHIRWSFSFPLSSCSTTSYFNDTVASKRSCASLTAHTFPSRDQNLFLCELRTLWTQSHPSSSISTHLLSSFSFGLIQSYLGRGGDRVFSQVQNDFEVISRFCLQSLEIGHSGLTLQ